jgi:membrane protease YdiL (CAAX protease family)
MASNSSAKGLGNQFLVLLIFGLLCAAPWLGGGGFVLPAMVIVLPLAIGFGSVYTIHLVVIFLASSLVLHLLPSPASVILGKGSGVLLYFYVVVLIGPMRRSLVWLRVGKFNFGSVALMAGIVVVSAIAVIVWTHLVPQSKAIHARIMPASVPGYLVPVYMGAFAIVNSLIEEIIWRGVMLTALEAAFGVGVFSLVLQAVQFGLAHYQGGFPNGWSGAGLTFLFGLAMGVLRRRSGGLVAAWIAHAAADFTIVWLVVHRVGMGG